MNTKAVWHTIEWGIALVACAYLAWRMATYDDYASLFEALRNMGATQWLALFLCVALVPVNMSLEAWRWKTLLPMSWRDAHRQVYYSKLAGLITPWQLGEYPARGLFMKDRMKEVLSMGVVGSVTMTAAIIFAGLVAILCTPSVAALFDTNYIYVLCAILAALFVLFLCLPAILRRWVSVNYNLLTVSLLQSFIRLLCWCVQLALVLYALGALDSQLSTLNSQLEDFSQLSTLHSQLFIYFLLLTVTPNVPVAEVGVRGAWAIWLFGSMNAAFAAVLLWFFNTLIPCLIWFFLRKK